MGQNNSTYELTEEDILGGVFHIDNSDKWTPERIERKIAKIEKERLEAEQKKVDEQLEYERLLANEQQRLIDIQADIGIKFKNNELFLTDEQRQELEIKKRLSAQANISAVPPPIIPLKPYLPLKQYWDDFVEWKKDQHKSKTGKNYSSNSLDNLRMSFNYLLDFIGQDEDYNIHDFTSLFFKELQ
jgi:hypothetical protein